MQNSELNLQFWDTTGQERMRSSFEIYLKGCIGAIIVEDFSSGVINYKRLNEWRKLLLQKASLSDGRPIPIIVLLNKSDLLESQNRESTETKTREEIGVHLVPVYNPIIAS